MGKMSQTDWIVFGVAAFVGIVATVVSMMTARTVVAPAAAPTVATGEAKLPDAAVTLATALPGGGGSTGTQAG